MKIEDVVLSVVIPCYNEVNTIETVIDAVRNCGIPNIEIIVVD
ncbi:MAG: glycosyltransferase, partial [Lachnospiraceae bacterium]|nr:glycosyltransferase [Lachnospiraceae bacterium]